MDFSIIIPVYREDFTTVKDAVDRLRETETPRLLEILLVVAGGDLSSFSSLNSEGVSVLSSPRTGRGFQLHFGAQQASGSHFLFLHVDTILPENWAAQIEEAFSSKQGRSIAFTGFPIQFDPACRSLRFIASAANWRSKWLTRVPQGDQAVAVPREVYFKSGGFEDVPLLEEYRLVRQLKRIGRYHQLEAPVVTSSRRYQQNGVWKNSLRNLFILTCYFFGASPQRLARWYR